VNEQPGSSSLLDGIRWWLYGLCFAYCVRMADPSADPSEFCLMDTVSFVAVEKTEIQEIIENTPDLAWHFEGRL
jgi:hypothetical protein